jgi:hypothetical protein
MSVITIQGVKKGVTAFKGVYYLLKWSENSQSIYGYDQKPMPADIWAMFLWSL